MGAVLAVLRHTWCYGDSAGCPHLVLWGQCWLSSPGTMGAVLAVLTWCYEGSAGCPRTDLVLWGQCWLSSHTHLVLWGQCWLCWLSSPAVMGAVLRWLGSSRLEPGVSFSIRCRVQTIHPVASGLEYTWPLSHLWTTSFLAVGCI